jgi:hypothetical protein
LQFTTENSDLESQADALLGIESRDLVQEDLETEDALSRSDKNIDSEIDEEADENDADEDSPSGPTMFGGTSKKKRKEDLH